MKTLEQKYTESYEGREGCFAILAAAVLILAIMAVPFVIAYFKSLPR